MRNHDDAFDSLDELDDAELVARDREAHSNELDVLCIWICFGIVLLLLI